MPPLRKAQRSLDSTQFPPKPERYEKVAYVRLVRLNSVHDYISQHKCLVINKTIGMFGRSVIDLLMVFVSISFLLY